MPSGHGYGVLILLEYMSMTSLIESNFQDYSNYPYEYSILKMALVSLIGKLVIIISLFLTRSAKRTTLIYIGLVLMVLPFLVIVMHTWNYDSLLFSITLVTGIPFLLFLIRTIYMIQSKQ